MWYATRLVCRLPNPSASLRDLQAENDRRRRQLDEASRAGKRLAAPFAKARKPNWFAQRASDGALGQELSGAVTPRRRVGAH
jgi:hypothetical protein